jgi:hypothetical protein
MEFDQVDGRRTRGEGAHSQAGFCMHTVTRQEERSSLPQESGLFRPSLSWTSRLFRN